MGGKAFAQLNTDRITAIGRNALYFDDYVLSIQYFNQVIRLKPYLAEPYLYRAIAKIQLEDYTGAVNDCNAAIENNPFLPGAFYTRGFVYRQLGEYEKAEQDFTQALLFAPENRTYMLLRADVRAQLKHFDEALYDMDFLLKREPKSASLHFERGTIALAQKDTTGALGSFAKAVLYDSQNAANWSAKGLVNILLENNTEALADLTEAINLGSRWAGDYINRGILYYQAHNYRAALADYDKAVEYNANDAQCYYNRGLLRAEVGDYNRALDDFNEAIKLEPENIEMYYQRGVVNLQLQQWENALTDFDKLIERYPYFLPSYYLAAQAKTALDDPRGAYQYQQKAHELETNKEEIRRQQQAAINTDVQLADNQPQKRDRRKEFSNRAAQNQATEEEEQTYQSEARGNVQNRYVDVVNEPNITLSYYAQNQSLRRTNYFHYLVADYNKQQYLPSPLHFTGQQINLSADMVAQHFENINNLTNALQQSNHTQNQLVAVFFARAIEFAVVGDYSSAVDDCTQALVTTHNASTATILYFLRANWRYKLLEYQRVTGELFNDKDKEEIFYKSNFELILRDLDQVILAQPDFTFAYYNKANILCAQKDYKAAIQYYTDAIKHDRDFAEAYFNRGLTYIYTDQIEEGIADLSKAGELGIYQAYNLITRFK